DHDVCPELRREISSRIRCPVCSATPLRAENKWRLRKGHQSRVQSGFSASRKAGRKTEPGKCSANRYHVDPAIDGCELIRQTVKQGGQKRPACQLRADCRSAFGERSGPLPVTSLIEEARCLQQVRAAVGPTSGRKGC